VIFLENLLQDKPKVGITNLLSNITTKPDSHKGGWARLLKCQLKNMYIDAIILTNADSLADFDVIIFDLGAEFSGSLNMFGGLDVEGRRSNASTCEAFKQTDTGFLGRVQEKLNQAGRFDHAYKTDSLLIGDSHTPGVWDPSFMIERQDGRTLYGSLQNRTISRIVKEHGGIHHLKVHMSSIDIRHHLCRQPDPEQSVYEMLTKLGQEVVDLRNQNVIQDVVLQDTMGIEDESRELPKTGYYKGTPFFGDWNRRNMVREYFNSKIRELAYMNSTPGLFDIKVESYPEYFFDQSGKLRFDVMERPQSVHISPAYYKWDLDENKLRWDRFHDIQMQSNFGVKDISAKLEKDMYGIE
jgi:hypothetical protein